MKKATQLPVVKRAIAHRAPTRVRGERVGVIEMLEHLNGPEKEALADLRQRLRSHLGDRLKKMILFGSKARGDFEKDSDLDVALIVQDLDRMLKRQVIDIVVDVELEYAIPFTSLVLSSKEFALLRSRERRIALDIDNEGIRL